jgi:hypothetical protein
MILPSRKFALLSALRPDEALHALGAAVAPRRNWKQKMFSRGKGGFMGEVTEGGFSLERDIAYRNSFLPRITGTIGPGSPSTRIEVSMKMDALVSGFMAVWLVFVVMSFLSSAYAYLQASGHPDGTFLVVTGGMALFGFILPHASFYPEANKAERFLKETLKAEKELPADGRRAI